MFRAVFIVIVFVLLCTVLAVSAFATSSVPLYWDANTEPDLIGYRIYHSTTPTGTFSLVAEVGTVTTWTATAVPDGWHCWRGSAIDSVGNEGPPSDAYCLQIDTAPPAKVMNFRAGTPSREQ